MIQGKDLLQQVSSRRNILADPNNYYRCQWPVSCNLDFPICIEICSRAHPRSIRRV
jgi:hypothetical protein